MTRNLRVALVANSASIHTRRWHRWLERRGHKVRLFSLVEAEGASYFGPGPPLDRRYVLTLGQGLRRTAARLRVALAEFGPDLTHGFYLTNHGHYAVRAGPGPVVVTALGSDVLVDPQASRLVARTVRRTARGADRVVAVAPHLARRLQEWGVAEERLLISPLGVDTSQFRPGTKEPLVLFSRGFRRVYDPLTLARALPTVASKVDHARFVLAGMGPLRAEVQELVRKRGLQDRVELPGLLPAQRMAGLASRARVVVSPSLSDGTPVSVLEGLASGAVLVASDIPANRQWVKAGRTGLLFPPGDVGSLAQALVEALTEDDLAVRALEEGPALARAEGDWEPNARQVEALYRELAPTG